MPLSSIISSCKSQSPSPIANLCSPLALAHIISNHLRTPLDDFDLFSYIAPPWNTPQSSSLPLTVCAAEQDASGPVTLRTRKFITNRLLQRRQCVLDVIHPSRANVSKEELSEKLATMYKANKEQVIVFGLKTKFGGGRSTGFALIYDSRESMNFEPRHRLVRVSILSRLTRSGSAACVRWMYESACSSGGAGGWYGLKQVGGCLRVGAAVPNRSPQSWEKDPIVASRRCIDGSTLVAHPAATSHILITDTQSKRMTDHLQLLHYHSHRSVSPRRSRSHRGSCARSERTEQRRFEAQRRSVQAQPPRSKQGRSISYRNIPTPYILSVWVLCVLLLHGCSCISPSHNTLMVHALKKSRQP